LEALAPARALFDAAGATGSQPTSFTLSVNLKTARALDLTIPRSILTRAEIVVD